MSDDAKPTPRWSDPVWTQGTSYRFVNVGDAPAFEVVIVTEDHNVPFSDLPPGEVPEKHIAMVAPGKAIDVTVQVADDAVGERPAGTSERSIGWPPVAPILTLAWNTEPGWTPPINDEPLLRFGLETAPRQQYWQLSLPINQLPDKVLPFRRTSLKRATGRLRMRPWMK